MSLKLVVDNSNMIDNGIDPAEMEDLRADFDQWLKDQDGIFAGKPIAPVIIGDGTGKCSIDEHNQKVLDAILRELV